jgi:hypothetical protein
MCDPISETRLPVVWVDSVLLTNLVNLGWSSLLLDPEWFREVDGTLSLDSLTLLLLSIGREVGP